MAAKKLDRVAREQLGFSKLRPEQDEAVRSVLDGRDTLVVQPTGSGKSAIYQAAGLVLKGTTVVVSPLIALQKDQMDAIREQPHDQEAALLNSTLKTSELREARQRVAEGAVEFVFLAPEQFAKPETLDMLRAANPSLFVVDEAHCISEWGHDFRPHYLQLGAVIEELGHPTVLAMTATATPRVRDEILTRLVMRAPNVLVRGFDRPNIALRVDLFRDEDEKREALVRRTVYADKPGIIYAGTRRAAEKIVGELQERGVHAVFYHAGMKAADRREIQDKFMSGDTEVIVATNAFGMGVDKPDVRFVYHHDISDSIDSYYQEIGRAGRDGQPAEAVLFYRPQDLGLRKFQTGGGKMEEHEIARVARELQNEITDAEEIARKTDLSPRRVTTIVNRLEDVGAAEMDDPQEAVRAAKEAHDEVKQGSRERLETMQRYAELSTCRREYLLRYFGDEYAGPCGNCDCDQSQQGAGTRREVS